MHREVLLSEPQGLVLLDGLGKLKKKKINSTHRVSNPRSPGL
jgi:hypothetical protein